MSRKNKISPQDAMALRAMLQQGQLITPGGESEPEMPAAPSLPQPKMWVGENGKYPAPATAGSAGYDLYSAVDIKAPVGKTIMVSTEVKMSIPTGCAAFIMSRSGLGVKKHIAVAQGVGLIDSDYRGEIFVPLFNRGNIKGGATSDVFIDDYEIKKGDAIAQMVFLPYAMIQFQYVEKPEELDQTERGEGGFGSTDETP